MHFVIGKEYRNILLRKYPQAESKRVACVFGITFVPFQLSRCCQNETEGKRTLCTAQMWCLPCHCFHFLSTAAVILVKSSSFSRVTLSVGQECYLCEGKNKSDLLECSCRE